MKGKMVVITRPKAQAEKLAEIITKKGGIPRIVPTIEIVPMRDLHPLKEFSKKIFSGEVGMVIFLSRNGVINLMKSSDILEIREKLVGSLNQIEIVAIGPKTKCELENQGIRVEFVPSNYSSAGIVKMLEKLNLRQKTVAVIRTELHNEYLKRELERMSEVLEVPIYTSTLPPNRGDISSLIDGVVKGEIDVITFTSSGAAQNLFKVAEEERNETLLRQCLNRNIIVAAIGPVTKKSLEDLGVKVHITPEVYTAEAMIDAIEDYLERLDK